MTCLALTRGNEDVNAVDLVLSKLKLLDLLLLVLRRPQENGLLTVKNVLDHLVGGEALNELELKGLHNLLNHGRQLSSLASRLDQAHGRLSGQVSTLDRVGLLASHGLVLGRPNDNGVPNHSGIAINVDSELTDKRRKKQRKRERGLREIDRSSDCARPLTS